jgi:mono/diheme cytochrome c family protein
MKPVLKWSGFLVVGVLVLVLGLVGWVQLTWSVDHPDTPYPAIVASDDPSVIAQGEYIFHAVAHCSTCHAPADQIQNVQFDFSRPPVGGNVIQAGPFGTFTAANLTSHPTGIGSMSDGEVARVIRHGIGRQGKVSPMMLLAVGPMSDEDLTAVISYLRTLEPVEAQRDPPVYGFLAKALSGRIKPRTGTPPEYVPAGGISLERGRYLAAGPAMCTGCHTPSDPMAGFAPSGPAFSGGSQAEPDRTDAAFEIIAPNLTPHAGTGHISGWSEDQFVARFQAGRIYAGSIMPWEAFQRMTEDDVRSIARYLRTIPPVERETGPPYRKRGSFRQ